MDQRKEVAEKLRRYREASVLSQKQVADALNIERSTYTKYETGDSEPSLNTLVKIAAIYNVSPLLLLPESDQPVKLTLREPANADSPIYQLSKDERGIVALYRALDKEQKRQLREKLVELSKTDSGS